MSQYVSRPFFFSENPWSYSISSRILFWHVTDELYNSVQALKTSDAFIARAIERKVPAQDIQAAQEAFKHL